MPSISRQISAITTAIGIVQGTMKPPKESALRLLVEDLKAARATVEEQQRWAALGRAE
jgi:hypothetical protein